MRKKYHFDTFHKKKKNYFEKIDRISQKNRRKRKTNIH